LDVYTLSGPLLWFEKFVSDATDLVVPMFFAVSGFLFYQNFNYSKLGSKLKSRVKSLFVPYVIWNVSGYLFLVLLLALPFVGSRMNRSLPPFEIIGFVKDVFIECNYNATWFLLDLMIFAIVTPIIKPLIDRKLIGGGILIALITIGLHFSVGKLL